MNKKYIIMSDEKSDICDSVRGKYEIISTDTINGLLPFESRHADMQCLRMDDTFFVLKEAVNLQNKLRTLGLEVITTEEDIKAEYPKNVLLNAIYMKNMLFCKADSIAGVVKDYCKNNEIKLIDVKQGYTKCSTAITNSCSITADRGIFDTMTKSGVEGLLIESGDIKLDGVNYGFIGGCSFYDNYTLYFTGDITKHKSYKAIKDFLYKHKINIVSLTNEKLYDIGGFIVI